MLSAAATTLLLGCAGHVHRLTAGDAAATWSAQLLHGGGDTGHRLIVERDGRRYEGSFRVERRRDPAALQTRFASEPRRRERLIAGLEGGYVRNLARVELRSAEGGRLHCQLDWPDGGRHAGHCSETAGPGFPLVFE